MRVILVERRERSEASLLGELEELARTMKHEVVGRVEQIRAPDPAYQIGRGKVAELARLVKATGAERVIFVNQLTPSQAFKLQKMVGVEVIDRLQLILEIFYMRAGTPEAKLQVEYARLKYELPRVRERVLAKLSVERPGLMGGGEYEIRVHQDAIKRRLNVLKKKLATIAVERAQKRKHRKKRGFRLVALAGYTNSGKSTLLNALTVGGAEVDDRYFTTLAPKTRQLSASRGILLTDTVGFIEGLPPWMVEAFKATLEEIYLADLVILVVDGSDEVQDIMRKYRASMEVLREYPVKIITALNKIDLLDDGELEKRLEFLSTLPQPVVPISALKGTNLDVLVDTIVASLRGGDG
ncbi:MAG: GTPase HflX [Candidatus Hadarchaeales archaeon]